MKKVYIEQWMRTKEEKASGKKTEVVYALEVGEHVDVLASRMGMGTRYFAKGKTDCYWVLDARTGYKVLINKLIFMRMLEVHTNQDLEVYKIHDRAVRAFLYRRPPMAYGVQITLIHNESIIQGVDTFSLGEYENETKRFRTESGNYRKQVAEAKALKKEIEETEEYVKRYQEMMDEIRYAASGIHTLKENLRTMKHNLRVFRNMGILE